MGNAQQSSTAPQARPPFEVADILRAHKEAYLKSFAVTPVQRKALEAIVACRTAALGGHLEWGARGTPCAPRCGAGARACATSAPGPAGHGARPWGCWSWARAFCPGAASRPRLFCASPAGRWRWAARRTRCGRPSRGASVCPVIRRTEAGGRGAVFRFRSSAFKILPVGAQAAVEACPEPCRP